MYRKNKINEFFTRKAKEEGYPARSVYKLKEIDEKYHLFKKGDKVLDLGCAPGSWLIYVASKIGSQDKVVGVDIKDIKIPPRENIIFIKKDVMDFEKSGIMESDQKYQAVISDLAPSTSGIELVDTGKSLELCEKAFDIAKKVLTPGGNFVCKIFEGEFTNDFFKKVEKSFKFTKRFRPKAVIKRSKEFYIVGKMFRGN
jgi:23S rRNA (uridine2552-2'-O)-methyltransferase